MSASFQSPRACISAIFVTGVFVSGETAGHVGVDNQRTCIRKLQIRPSNLIRILLGCLPSPAGVPLRAGVGGTGDRDFLPANPVPPLCRHPFTPAATWEIDNLGRPLDGIEAFPRIKFLQEPARGLFEAFRSQFLSYAPRSHEENLGDGVMACLENVFPNPEKEFPRMT